MFAFDLLNVNARMPELSPTRACESQTHSCSKRITKNQGERPSPRSVELYCRIDIDEAIRLYGLRPRGNAALFPRVRAFARGK